MALKCLLIKGVFSFHSGSFYTHLYLAGTVDSVLIKGKSSFQLMSYKLFLRGTG